MKILVIVILLIQRSESKMSMKSYNLERRMKSLKKRGVKGSGGCHKQFPDCPEEPNDNDCKGCPFYK